MINVGVIGCGYWGPNLIRNFNSCSKVNLKWDDRACGRIAWVTLDIRKDQNIIIIHG